MGRRAGRAREECSRTSGTPPRKCRSPSRDGPRASHCCGTWEAGADDGGRGGGAHRSELRPAADCRSLFIPFTPGRTGSTVRWCSQLRTGRENGLGPNIRPVSGALGAGGYLRPWQPRSRGSDKSRLDDRVRDDQRRHLSFSTSFGRPGPQFGAQPYIRFSPRRERSTSARDVVLADSALAPIMPVASGGNWVPCQKGVGIGPVVGR